MLFTKLKINYFGQFHNKEIELKPGINLIYGENEAGKSTLHAFIKGMLFGIDRMRGRGASSKEDIYTRYLPWDYPGAYSGSMDLKMGDKEYRLQRSFHAGDKSFTILDLWTGREVKLKEGLISELFPGLTEATFKNTISIEQLKAPTDADLAAQVRNYITNLSVTKSNEVNVAKAVSILNEQRKQLELTQNGAVLKSLQVEIAEGVAREEKIDQCTLQLQELIAEEQKRKKQKEALEDASDKEIITRIEQLPAMLEKFRSYQELTKQSNILEEQEKELEAKISLGEKEQWSKEGLKDDFLEAQRSSTEYVEQQKLVIAHQKNQELLQQIKQKILIISILPAVVIALGTLVLSEFQPVGILLASILLGVGAVTYVALSSNIRKKQRVLEEKKTVLEQQKEAAQEKVTNILKKNQVSHMEDLASKQEELLKSFYTVEHAKEQKRDLEKRKNDLEDSRDVMYETIMKYMQYFIEEEELSLVSMQRLQEEIRLRKVKTSDSLVEINRRYEDCKLRKEKLQWEISSLEGNEKQLLKSKDQYLELEQKQKKNAVELEAIKLALTSIQELSTDLHDSFGHQLNHAVSEVISEVTEQKYTDLKVDEKLEIKVGWKGDYILLDRLSAGTIDQVYFALRLAVADLLLGKNEVPLLLDDSFALYDETRVKAALQKIAERTQIILFTCHTREQKLLEELGIPYHMVDLSR